MRNLKHLVNFMYSDEGLSNSQVFNISYSHHNNNIFKRKGYVFVYKEGDVFCVNPYQQTCTLITSIKNISDPGISVCDVFYNSVLNTLNVALVNGDVYSAEFDDDLSGLYEMQCVGSIGTGIQTVSISPDTETVVFLTGDDDLIIMSGSLDPISETNLLGSDQGEKEMVNVGWGKKETQFHGSEGKEAAKKRLNETPNEQIILEESNKKAVISWRGDSSLFAVNYWCGDKMCRRVKIFDKAGTLQWTSELLPGLEGVMSWKPSGSLIALAQTLPNKHVICFMEKNGLRHGEFTLPHNIKVNSLSWNCESTILSAACVDRSTGGHCVLLWTVRNYHWYLKQRLDYRSEVVSVRWDEGVGNLSHTLLSDGTYLTQQWVWTVDHSPGTTDEDLAVVAVIDGCDVKLTCFKKCVVPPPMCGATVTLPAPALQVMFAPDRTNINDTQFGPNDICVYLSDGRLAFISGVDSSPQLHNVTAVEWDCPEPPLAGPASLTHWLWLADDQLICVVCADGFHLCHIKVNGPAATVMSMLPLPEPVVTVTLQPPSSRVLLQSSSGALLTYQDGHLTPAVTLPELCVAVRCVAGHTFARAHAGRLYVDGALAADNVTSFFCLPQCLVLTQSSHRLRVASALSGFKVEEDDAGTARRLERGSSLVVVVGHSVILQLPRGNLETVEPRALTLVTAARLLDAGDYKTVAQLLRRQRINLNLVVDHNPSSFLLSVSRLVGQVRDPQWLSVFLAELSEQDVTRGMYAGHYRHLAGRGGPLVDKVQRVCGALRAAMSQSPDDRTLFLQPILSSYVRAGEVGEAIRLADTDQALGYLTLLIDTDRLYEEALGVYNLEKALKIAGKSLKDPKEYVAYLNELREMEPAYMRFTVDKRLRRPQSALRNLAQCPDRQEECLQYVVNTSLYPLALQLFKDQPEIYAEVCRLYGSHLEAGGRPEEAGMMYRRGGDVTRALSSLTRAGCWRQCLTIAAQQQFSDAELQELQQGLYRSLSGRGEWGEAGALCERLGWSERAVTCSVEARLWSHAVLLCHEHRLTSLIDEVVKPALLDSQSRFLSELVAKRAGLDKHSTRLAVVRQRKNDPDNFDAMSDIQSDTSSLSSFTTSSAGTRTTKNTRKAQRKLWSLKEGNPREEHALLYTITELVQTTERLAGDVHTTCLALTDLNLDDEARSLHTAMADALTHVEQVKLSVWPAYSAKKSGSDADAIDPTSIDLQLSYPPTPCVAPSWKLHLYS